VRAQRRNRGSGFRRRRHGATDQICGHQRPCGIVNDHNLGPLRDARERVGDRCATLIAAAHDRHRLAALLEIGRRRCGQGSGQRDDDLRDHVARHEGIHAHRQDRPSAERQQLLGRGSAKAQAAPARSNDG
jgi:hypothetical protein